MLLVAHAECSVNQRAAHERPVLDAKTQELLRRVRRLGGTTSEKLLGSVSLIGFRSAGIADSANSLASHRPPGGPARTEQPTGAPSGQAPPGSQNYYRLALDHLPSPVAKALQIRDVMTITFRIGERWSTAGSSPSELHRCEDQAGHGGGQRNGRDDQLGYQRIEALFDSS